MKFWQNILKANSVELLDKLLLGKNSDGSTVYADVNQIRNLIAAYTQGAIIPTRVAAGTVLGSPTEPKIYYAGAGTYTAPAPTGTITLTANLNMLFWDLVTWSWLEVPVSVNLQALKSYHFIGKNVIELEGNSITLPLIRRENGGNWDESNATTLTLGGMNDYVLIRKNGIKSGSTGLLEITKGSMEYFWQENSTGDFDILLYKSEGVYKSKFTDIQKAIDMYYINNKDYHFVGNGKLDLVNNVITIPLIRRKNADANWDESTVTTIELGGSYDYVLIRKNGIKTGLIGLLELTKGTKSFFWQEDRFSEYDVLLYKSEGVYKSQFSDIQRGIDIYYSKTKSYHLIGNSKIELEGNSITFPIIRTENASFGYDESNALMLTLGGMNDYVLIRKNGIKSGTTGLLELTKGTKSFFWQEDTSYEYDVLLYKSSGVYKSQYTDIQKAIDVYYNKAKVYHLIGNSKIELEGNSITFPLMRRDGGDGNWDESTVTTIELGGSYDYVVVRKNGIKSGTTGLLELTKGTKSFFWQEDRFSEYDVLLYKSEGVYKSQFSDIQRGIDIYYSKTKSYHLIGNSKIELEGNSITFPLMRRDGGDGNWDESTVTTIELGGSYDYVVVRKNGIKSGTTGLLELTKGTKSFFWQEDRFSEYDVLLYKSEGVYKSQYTDIQKAIDLVNKGYIDDRVVSYNQYIAPNQNFTTQTGWLTHVEKVQTDGSIKKIRINVSSAGTYTFAVGILDQFSKQIIRNTYNVTLVAGEQTINVSFPVKGGDNLFLRINSNVKYWHSGGSGVGTNFLYSDDPLSALMYLGSATYGGGIPLSFFVENRDSIFAFKEDLIAINQKVSSIETIQNANSLKLKSDDGKEWQLKISNSGVLSATALTVTKWIALGNSITIHPITNFWWGNWGMAATTREKDWVHLLNAKIATKYSLTPVFVAKNIATWEQNYSTYNLSLLDSYFAGDESLVVLKIGENVTYAANYSIYFDNLVKYVKARCQIARVIVAGTFWRQDEKENIHKSVAAANNCIYVQLYQLDNPANMSTLDTQVFGDDGQWHTISSGGAIATAVANHPGDVGMLNIANAIFSVI